MNRNISAFLQKERIRREFSCRHTPQQNEVAKRKNRHILEGAQAMLNEKHMPKSYWAEAANMAAHLMNRCTTSGVHDLTPYEKFYGKKLDLSHVQILAPLRTCTSLTRSAKSSTRSRRNVSS